LEGLLNASNWKEEVEEAQLIEIIKSMAATLYLGSLSPFGDGDQRSILNSCFLALSEKVLNFPKNTTLNIVRGLSHL